MTMVYVEICRRFQKNLSGYCSPNSSATKVYFDTSVGMGVFILNKLVIILFLALLGCQHSEPGESMDAKMNSTPSATSNAENEPFSVHVSVPQQVKANENFTIDVELKNKAERKVKIISGDPVFYYVIRDNTGKSINMIARTDVGVVHSMVGSEVISEKHPYQFKNPGIYEVSAIAEFSVQGGEDNEVYKMETAQKQIKVIE
jgi:hypothetical protein